jgi:hypothetical protein
MWEFGLVLRRIEKLLLVVQNLRIPSGNGTITRIPREKCLAIHRHSAHRNDARRCNWQMAHRGWSCWGILGTAALAVAENRISRGGANECRLPWSKGHGTPRRREHPGSTHRSGNWVYRVFHLRVRISPRCESKSVLQYPIFSVNRCRHHWWRYLSRTSPSTREKLPPRCLFRYPPELDERDRKVHLRPHT